MPMALSFLFLCVRVYIGGIGETAIVGGLQGEGAVSDFVDEEGASRKIGRQKRSRKKRREKEREQKQKKKRRRRKKRLWISNRVDSI